MPPNIYDFVRVARDNYREDEIEIVEGYEYSQYDTLLLIELYDNSRYLNGQTDDLDRIKPFYNIGHRILTISDTAEDIDRKDMAISTEQPEKYVQAWMLSKANQKWMDKAGFAQTLNDMTHTRGKYGGVLVKKTETDKDLHIDVVDWRNLITDTTDIKNGIKIYRHFYTPATLLKAAKDLDWNMDAVHRAIYKAETNQDDDEDGGGEQRKTHTPYIEVFEAHGVFPKSYSATEEEEAAASKEDRDLDHEYEQRVFILAGLDSFTGKDGDKKLYDNDCILFTEIEEEDPYKYLAYEKIPGRGLGRGRLEKAFESQAWTNDIVLKQRDILDLSSKTLFVTDDPKFTGNVTTEKNTGDILNVSAGKSVSLLNTTPASLQFMPSLMEQWNTQIERASSTYAANTGAKQPANTPYSLVALQNQEANSTFLDRRDEMGSFLEEIWRDWVIPFHVKRLKKKHVLVAEFDVDELKIIDQSFIDYDAGQKFLDNVLSRGSLEAVEEESPLEMLMQDARSRVTKTKNKRFLDMPEGYFDGVEYDLTVNISDERMAKAAYLESASSALTTVANSFNPQTGKFQILEDATLSKIFYSIMETAGGISPVELQATVNDMQVQPNVEQSFQAAPPAELPPELAGLK